MNPGMALNPLATAAGALSPSKPGTTPMIHAARMALLVGYPSLIPDTVTLVKYLDGEPSAFSRYPLIVTGDPPPRSAAGSPVPTGLPLIAVIVSPPSGSLPSAMALGLLRMLATVSRGVSVVVWMLPLDVLYTTVIGFPALSV